MAMSIQNFRFPVSALVAHAVVIIGIAAAAYSGLLPSVRLWRVYLWIVVACSLLASCSLTAFRMRSDFGRTWILAAGFLGFAGGLMMAASMLRNAAGPDAFLVAGAVSFVGTLGILLLWLSVHRAPRV